MKAHSQGTVFGQIFSLLALLFVANLLLSSATQGGPRFHETENELQAKENFVAANPATLEAMNLRVDLGHSYRSAGRFSRSLQHWDETWASLKDAADGPQKLAADAALAHRAHLMASLGRLDELQALIKEQAKRNFTDDQLSMMWGRTKEAVYHMSLRPEVSYKCGVYALNNVAKQMTGKDFGSIAWIPSALYGFTLGELESLAKLNQLPLRAAFRAEGATLIVPSVVHWSQNHYAALVDAQGGKLSVVDPTFGDPSLLTPEAVNEEASGYFLIPEQKLPPGWRWVAAEEANFIHGMGYPWFMDDDGCDCDQTKQGGSDADPMPQEQTYQSGGCASCGTARSSGMPSWQIFEPNMNVEIFDTPMSYTPAYGPSFQLNLAYRQRSLSQQTANYNNTAHLSLGWSIYHTPTIYSADWFASSGLPDMSLQLHRRANFRHLLHFAAGSTISDTHFLSGAWAKRFEVGGKIVAVEVYYIDGSIDRFDQYTAPQNLHLTWSKDRSGYALNYGYENFGGYTRLIGVTNAENKVFQFTYDLDPNALDPLRILGVSGPDGRSVSFTYDSNGRLQSVTDVVGLQSTFTYSNTGAGGIHLDGMTTPYGITSFYCYVPDPTENPNGINNVVGNGIDRYVIVTEPDGTSKQVFVFYDRVTSTTPIYSKIPVAFAVDQIPNYTLGAPSFDTTDITRNQHNSHHWNRQQAAALSDPSPLSFSVVDFRISTTRHWLGLTGHPSSIAAVLGWVLPASRDGSVEELPTFYDYAGKDTGNGINANGYFVDYREIVGTSRSPNVEIQRRPDLSTWWRETSRNAHEKPLTVSENWVDGGSLITRNSTYTYLTGTGDPTLDDLILVEQKGPYGELIRGAKTHPTYKWLPVEETNAVGEVTVLTYNADRLLATRTTPGGLLQTYTYDATAKRLLTLVDSQGGTPIRTNSYTWLNGQLRTQTDARGLMRTFDYDFLDRVTQITYNSDSTTEQFSYSLPAFTGFNTGPTALPLIDRVKKKDRMGYDYYLLANRLRQTEKSIEPSRLSGQAGVEHTYAYCGCGSPSTITRASNKAEIETTSYVFDYRGNPTTINLPDSVTINREYDRLGRRFKEVDAFSLTTNVYDNLSRLVAIRNGKGLVSGSGFDLRDRVIAYTNSSGIWSTTLYDTLGRTTVRSFADSVPSSPSGRELWSYSPGIAAATTYTNQIGVITTWKFDALQRKTNEVVTLAYTNKYRFYPGGDLYQLKDGADQLTSWAYDLEGHVLKKLDANNTEILRYTNNANGWLKSRWSLGKGTTYYAYDSVGNLTGVDYPTSGDLTFVYDNLNRISSHTVSGGTTIYNTYRPGGLPETESVSGLASSTVTFGYTGQRRTSLTVQQPVIGSWNQAYNYDGAKRLTDIVSPPGTFSYVYPVDTSDYKASRQVTRISIPNGSLITNTFDTVGRELSTILKNSSGNVLNSHAYLVNTANQRTRQTRTDGSYVNYTYDNAIELREGLTFTSGNAAVTSENFKYGYDTAQNMKARTNDTTVSSYSLNNLNQVTGEGTFTYSYDSNGNRTGKLQTGSIFYTYDDENQLIRAETDTVNTAANSRWRTEFSHDAIARLRSRKEYTWVTTPSAGWSLQSETKYLYDGRRAIQERNASNLPLVTYVRGLDLSGSLEDAGGIGGLLGRTAHSGANGATLTHAFYHADGNGNVTKMINTSQSSVADYKYDPFGRTLSSSGTLASANTYRFSSKELMTTSGFYYYGYRFYDPSTQRWINRDPIEEDGGINLFGFVGNNSINFVDTDGRVWWWPPFWGPAPPNSSAPCTNPQDTAACVIICFKQNRLYGRCLITKITTLLPLSFWRQTVYRVCICDTEKICPFF